MFRVDSNVEVGDDMTNIEIKDYSLNLAWVKRVIEDTENPPTFDRYV